MQGLIVGFNIEKILQSQSQAFYSIHNDLIYKGPHDLIYKGTILKCMYFYIIILPFQIMSLNLVARKTLFC